MEIAILLNKIAGFSLRAKIETLLNAKSCQRGPGLAAIVINNLLGEDYGAPLPIDTLREVWENGSVMSRSRGEFSFARTARIAWSGARTKGLIVRAVVDEVRVLTIRPNTRFCHYKQS